MYTMAPGYTLPHEVTCSFLHVVLYLRERASERTIGKQGLINNHFFNLELYFTEVRYEANHQKARALDGREGLL